MFHHTLSSHPNSYHPLLTHPLLTHPLSTTLSHHIILDPSQHHPPPYRLAQEEALAQEQGLGGGVSGVANGGNNGK